MDQSSTAIAHPNIALIKYWGNQDDELRIPSNGSISINLAGLESRTKVTFDHSYTHDTLLINGVFAEQYAQERVSAFLDVVRKMSDEQGFAHVESINNFPAGTGIASSASAFAALALAASTAAGLRLTECELSRLARRGSGSACRSIPGGFVEWFAGKDDHTSLAASFAPPEYWALADCIVIVSQTHKSTGSSEGHATAKTSPLQETRIATTPARLTVCREAILKRDFFTLAEVVEMDSNLMHAVMMTSQPPLLYWEPATITIMKSVQEWRKNGLACFYTIDAGPNVHVICPIEVIDEISKQLSAIPGIMEVRTATVGRGARSVDER